MPHAPEKQHSKYIHVYAIVRFEEDGSMENSATVVKVLPSRVLAEEEARRLREVNKAKKCTYVVQTTRFVGTSFIAEN